MGAFKPYWRRRETLKEKKKKHGSCVPIYSNLLLALFLPHTSRFRTPFDSTRLSAPTLSPLGDFLRDSECVCGREIVYKRGLGGPTRRRPCNQGGGDKRQEKHRRFFRFSGERRPPGVVRCGSAKGSARSSRTTAPRRLGENKRTRTQERDVK